MVRFSIEHPFCSLFRQPRGSKGNISFFKIVSIIIFIIIYWLYRLLIVEVHLNITLELTVSQDELANGLRFQELQFSTTKINASLHANLPEKLAAAEAQEADQREAKGIILINSC